MVDEGVTTTYYRDADLDTYGNPAVTTQACSAPAGYVANNTDCNDSNAAVHPGATEVCNGIDDDCDTRIDEGVKTTYYRDFDLDTYGDPAVTTQACSAPAGYVANNTDCNDSNAAVHPGATEVCNGIDDDCDGQTDDEGATGCTTYYKDADADTYGVTGDARCLCAASGNYTATRGGDCGDSNASVHPGATEVHNGIDDDCDGLVDEVLPAPVYPTVTTRVAADITTNSATLGMSYTVGDFSLVEVRFAYRKSTDSTWSYTVWVPKTAGGTHAEVLTGLDFNTAYDFKSQLKYDGTVVGGTTLQFTTDTPSPSGSGGCFIATAAYGTPAAKQIDVLRKFRDIVLLKSTVGSQFVALYYQLSPPIADFIAGNSFLSTLVRELLVDPIVWVVQATGDTQRN
jgi:hypothetical protein